MTHTTGRRDAVTLTAEDIIAMADKVACLRLLPSIEAVDQMVAAIVAKAQAELEEKGATPTDLIVPCPHEALARLVGRHLGVTVRASAFLPDNGDWIFLDRGKFPTLKPTMDHPFRAWDQTNDV